MVNQASGSRSFRERSGWGFSEVAFFCVLALALVAVFFCGRFAYREGTLLEGAKTNAQAISRWADAVAAANAKGEPFAPQPCSLLLLPPAPPPEAAAGVLPEGRPAPQVAEAESSTPVPAPPEARLVPVALVPPDTGRPASEAEVAPATDTPVAADTVAERSPPTWQSCREALFGAGGPFAEMTNPFNKENTVLGTKCERKSAATRGHVLVEKGTAPPAGVSGSTSWGPLEDKEVLAKGLLLRIQVCDAGGYAIKVAEVTL